MSPLSIWLIAFCLVSLPYFGEAGWDLKWEDNFSGTSVNETRWKTSKTSGWIKHMQDFVSSQLSVSDGNLSITLQNTSSCRAGWWYDNYTPTAPAPLPYHGGAIMTKTELNPNTRIEIRARLPTDTDFKNLKIGMWLIGGHPCRQEIDIFEQWLGAYTGNSNALTKFLGTYHFNPDSNPDCKDTQDNMIPKKKEAKWYTSTNYNDGKFHVFALDWFEDEWNVTVDGSVTSVGERVYSFPLTDSKYHATYPMDLIITLGVCGAEWCWNKTSYDLQYICDTEQFKIDYVKVYDYVAPSPPSPAHAVPQELDMPLMQQWEDPPQPRPRPRPQLEPEFKPEAPAEEKPVALTEASQATGYILVAMAGFGIGAFCVLCVLCVNHLVTGCKIDTFKLNRSKNYAFDVVDRDSV